MFVDFFNMATYLRCWLPCVCAANLPFAYRSTWEKQKT